MKTLNALLLLLSIVICAMFILQLNPWVFICIYWLVTVIKNGVTE